MPSLKNCEKCGKKINKTNKYSLCSPCKTYERKIKMVCVDCGKPKTSDRHERCWDCWKKFSKHVDTKEDREKRLNYSREYYKKHREEFLKYAKEHPSSPELRRKRNIWNKYGLTPEEYDLFFSRADYKCQICGKPLDMADRKRGCGIHLDHNHKTGKIRGVLCGDCNLAIGKLGDDVKGVLKALEYLIANNE